MRVDSNNLITAVILIILITGIIYTGFQIYSESTKVYPEINMTVTVIEKYDPSRIILVATSDGVEHPLYVGTLDNYMAMHRDKTYKVNISLRSNNVSEPVWSSDKYNYLVTVLGEVK